jgi:hypothetical protein
MIYLREKNTMLRVLMTLEEIPADVHRDAELITTKSS